MTVLNTPVDDTVNSNYRNVHYMAIFGRDMILGPYQQNPDQGLYQVQAIFGRDSYDPGTLPTKS